VTDKAADDLSWSKDWTVGVRIWVERRGKAILGKGRLELLEGIDRWRSISAAARQMGMSYRRAWLLVQGVNAAAGKPLVEAAVGGTSGGGAQLTPRGRLAVTIFRNLQHHVHQSAASRLPGLVRQPGTASVHLAAAVSLEEVLGQLLADYALQQPAVSVRTLFGASDELAEHLLAGAPADLFLAADERQLDRLEPAGVVDPGTRTVLALNSLAAIGPSDRPSRIRSARQLLGPGVSRVALAQTSSPLGGYTRDYLVRLRLYETLAKQVLFVDNSRAVMSAVRAGRADVGLVYSSDAFAAAGCRILFHAGRTQPPIRYTAALIRRGQRPVEAQALLRFLTSRPARERFRNCGFLPPLLRG
jgi:molybdenum ABC transporter molybdate-binding protein